MTYSKLDEIAQKQKQREEEAEARRNARKTGGAYVPEPSAERTAPRLSLASRPAAAAAGGGGGGWRDRLAAKEASGDAAESVSAAAPAPAPAREEPAPLRKGGYVPPHLRGAASSGSAPPARENGPSERSDRFERPERNDRFERPERTERTDRFVPRHLRDPSAATPEAPPAAKPEESKPSGGKWVPRWKQQQS